MLCVAPKKGSSVALGFRIIHGRYFGFIDLPCTVVRRFPNKRALERLYCTSFLRSRQEIATTTEATIVLRMVAAGLVVINKFRNPGARYSIMDITIALETRHHGFQAPMYDIYIHCIANFRVHTYMM